MYSSRGMVSSVNPPGTMAASAHVPQEMVVPNASAARLTARGFAAIAVMNMAEETVVAWKQVCKIRARRLECCDTVYDTFVTAYPRSCMVQSAQWVIARISGLGGSSSISGELPGQLMDKVRVRLDSKL